MALRDDVILEIKNKYLSGSTIAAIAEELELGYDAVYRVVTGRSYSSITGIKKELIRNIDSNQIVDLIEDGTSITKISRLFGISATAVSKKYKDATGRSVSDFRKSKTVRYGEK